VLPANSVRWYLLKGGRHLDTAQLYLNHKAVGEGIAQAIARGVPRKEIFLVTKLTPRSYADNGPTEAVAEFLKELHVDYIDLVLLLLGAGCPAAQFAACRANAWTQLTALQKTGAVRDLGVSNFGVNQIKELQALGMAPMAANQIQFNPWAPDWQIEVFDFCKEQRIAVTAWAPFQGTMMQNAAAFTVETLAEVAASKKRTVPQVMLRWALQKGAAVIPGTGNPHHMAENLDVYSFSLSPAEMASIDGLREDPKARDFVAMGFENTED